MVMRPVRIRGPDKINKYYNSGTSPEKVCPQMVDAPNPSARGVARRVGQGGHHPSPTHNKNGHSLYLTYPKY